jgi:anthranilate synthase component I
MTSIISPPAQKTRKLTIRSLDRLADTITPVQLYLKLRDVFPGAVLLESGDSKAHENSRSYIALEPIAGFVVQNGMVTEQVSGQETHQYLLDNERPVMDVLREFIAQFEVPATPGIANGLFGYCAYDAIPHFEEIDLIHAPAGPSDIPEMRYHIYRYLIAIDHFRNRLQILENVLGNSPSRMPELTDLLQRNDVPAYPFKTKGDESSTLSDTDYLALVQKGIAHCKRGDVFQIVLSRRFAQQFQGDDFNVYRCLRSINPSPYLFYFDYGSYRIFGSSPEAQLVVKDGKATIHPIAGTFRRSGDDAGDRALAEALARDPKENAEHVMLVDLARNDLGRSTTKVQVETFKEVQYFSHVIHLVSKVTGILGEGQHGLQVFADAFPAGTLSGAPKHRAMQLIAQYEPHRRGCYGGAVGLLGFDGSLNTAIIIRSFVSQHHTLYYQAGAGIVAASNPESEVQEVHHKLAALKRAIQSAQTI